jgi:hypothetical protein
VETVTAVLVHHDTDLYDLKVRTGRTTSVIDTTSNHLFWVPAGGGGGGRWVKAGSLKYGTHLRTPSGTDNAVVAGGWVPAQRDGWMWDLTITPSHDFYIGTEASNVLVHNCAAGDPRWVARAQAARNAANRAAGNDARDAIAAMYPGSQTEVPFGTELGARIVDVLTPENLAIESNVGYTTISNRIMSQIAKDQLLMQNGDVSGVKWMFSPNEYGEVGPSGPLANTLEQAGFSWEIRTS